MRVLTFAALTCSREAQTGFVLQRNAKTLLLLRGHSSGACSYELHIRSIRLLDFYGGAQEIAPEDYFAARGRAELAAAL